MENHSRFETTITRVKECIYGISMVIGLCILFSKPVLGALLIMTGCFVVRGMED